MNLAFLDGQCLEFVVVFCVWGDAPFRFGGILRVRSGALLSSRPIAVGQLRYREDSLRIAFCTLLAGHRVKQAQVVAFDGEAATPRLEVADGAMLVQDDRRRLPTAPGPPDRFDDLASPSHAVPDLHSSVAVATAVNQCPGVGQYPGGL